jgi:pimeloyl-ACP methyl ester carboxylesterase
MIRFALLVALGLLLLFPAVYWWKGAGLKPLDAAARNDLRARGLAHSFASLSKGDVHYQEQGPPNGPVVLLVHGFAGPMFVWDDVIPQLTARGYRVVAFDGYGRGLSARPAGVYDANLMDTEIVELLDHLQIGGPVNVVGYSAGGATATIFAARHPDRVSTLSLISPGGLAAARPLPGWLFRAPGMASWFGRVVAPGLFLKFFDKTLVGLPNAGRLKDLAQLQFRYAGAGEALTSMALHYPIVGAAPYYEAVAKTPIPVFLVWGEADTTNPFAMSSEARRLLPRAQFLAVPKAEHNIVYAQPDAVGDRLATFLAAHPRAD